MVFSFRVWCFCDSKHNEGFPMAQLFATDNLHHYMDSTKMAQECFAEELRNSA